jgi:hypothetical protein
MVAPQQVQPLLAELNQLKLQFRAVELSLTYNRPPPAQQQNQYVVHSPLMMPQSSSYAGQIPAYSPQINHSYLGVSPASAAPDAMFASPVNLTNLPQLSRL